MAGYIPRRFTCPSKYYPGPVSINYVDHILNGTRQVAQLLLRERADRMAPSGIADNSRP